MFDFREIISVSLVLFSVIDIIGSIPIVIDLREKFGHVQSGKATIISGAIMIAFLFIGEGILQLFGLDVASFAIAGAVVMLLLGLEMVLGMQIFKSNVGSDTGTSVVPLAFPLIAGAGTLTSLLSLKAEFATSNILVGIIVNLTFVFVVLKSCGWLERKIGKTGFGVLRRVFGVILLAIAVKIFKNHLFV